MSQPKLKVERAKTADLIPYVGNAKIHTAEQVDQIAASIEQFGFSDPIGVWTNPDGRLEIVEGHGRVMAANLLGMEEVPIIRLDHLDDAARRAYTHVHNQTALSSGFDFGILDEELTSIDGFDWADFGFTQAPLFEAIEDLLENDFSGRDGDGPGMFAVAFYFPEESRELIERYVNEAGKTEIARVIASEAEKWA